MPQLSTLEKKEAVDCLKKAIEKAHGVLLCVIVDTGGDTIQSTIKAHNISGACAIQGISKTLERVLAQAGRQ